MAEETPTFRIGDDCEDNNCRDNERPEYVSIDELSTIVVTEGMDVVAKCDTEQDESNSLVDGNVITSEAKAIEGRAVEDKLSENNQEYVEMDTCSPPPKQRRKRGRKPKSQSLGQVCDSDNEDGVQGSFNTQLFLIKFQSCLEPCSSTSVDQVVQASKGKKRKTAPNRTKQKEKDATDSKARKAPKKPIFVRHW